MENLKADFSYSEMFIGEGFDFIKLNTKINKMISEIKLRSYFLKNIEIHSSKNNLDVDPYLIDINSEGIRLRFNNIYQELELIEIDINNDLSRTLNLEYRGLLLIDSQNKSKCSYNQIADKLNKGIGTPEIVKSNIMNKIYLKYDDGVIFIFENEKDIDNKMDITKYSNSIYLSGIIIFNGNMKLHNDIIIDMVNFNYKFKNSILKQISQINPFNVNDCKCENHCDYSMIDSFENLDTVPIRDLVLISQEKITIRKFQLTKSKIYRSNFSNDIIISLGDNYDYVLTKLGSPNNIYQIENSGDKSRKRTARYKSNENQNLNQNLIKKNESLKDSSMFGKDSLVGGMFNKISKVGKIISNLTTSDNKPYTSILLYNKSQYFMLNYFDLGIDIMVDRLNYKVQKIIIHNNNYISPNFLFYNRCNFLINLNADLFADKDSKSNSKNNYFSESRKNSEYSQLDMSINNYKTIEDKENNVIMNNKKLKFPFEIENTDKIEIIAKPRSNSESINRSNNTSLISEKMNTTENSRNVKYTKINKRNSAVETDFSEKRKSKQISNKFLNLYNNKEKNSLDMTQESFNNFTLLETMEKNKIKKYLFLTPNSNFETEILQNLPYNTMFPPSRKNINFGVVSRYYNFDWISFEVLDNNRVETITIYSPKL